MEEYQNPSDCGSPAKYQTTDNVQSVGNSCGRCNVNGNAQTDIGFDANYDAQDCGVKNAEGTAGKKYMCKMCGTMHYGNEAPKNCCKCDCCDFKEV